MLCDQHYGRRHCYSQSGECNNLGRPALIPTVTCPSRFSCRVALQSKGGKRGELFHHSLGRRAAGARETRESRYLRCPDYWRATRVWVKVVSAALSLFRLRHWSEEREGNMLSAFSTPSPRPQSKGSKGRMLPLLFASSALSPPPPEQGNQDDRAVCIVPDANTSLK